VAHEDLGREGIEKKEMAKERRREKREMGNDSWYRSIVSRRFGPAFG
jgi:hypothetical protein